MATSGLGQRMSRAVTSVLPPSFSASLDKFQRVGLHISPVSQGLKPRPRRMGDKMEKVDSTGAPRRRVAPISSLSSDQNTPKNGSRGGRSGSNSEAPSGPASSAGTPCFGGLSGIEEQELEEVQKEISKEVEIFSPLTRTENGNENKVFLVNGNGNKALSEAQACVILQRWWKRRREAERIHYERLVLELMDLRDEAALQVQRIWRAILKNRCRRALAGNLGGTPQS